jgi:hypothetical protein
MISKAKLAANRANAQKSTGPRTAGGRLRSAQNTLKSTGPRTAAGKARSAQNARRHGLTHSALSAPQFAQAVAGLAHAVAAGSKDPQVIALAIQFAAAQIDIVRARQARVELLAAHPFDNIQRAAATDWYERIARTRRKAAIRALGDALAGSSPPAAQGEGRSLWPPDEDAHKGDLCPRPDSEAAAFSERIERDGVL